MSSRRCRSFSVLVLPLVMASCGGSIDRSEEQSVQTEAEFAGVEFVLRGVELTEVYSISRAPGTAQELHVVEFTGSSAHIDAAINRNPQDVGLPMSLDPLPPVAGCVTGGTIGVEVTSRFVGLPSTRAERAFAATAGARSGISINMNLFSPSGITAARPEHLQVYLSWSPDPFGDVEFDYVGANGSDYAAKVPTAGELRALMGDVYRSFVAAVADGPACEPGTELTEEQLLEGFDRALADATAVTASEVGLAVEPLGVPVEAAPTKVDAAQGFVIEEFDGEWERAVESVRVVGDRSLAGVDGAELERRLIAITEDGRELVTDADWEAAETAVYTPNFVAVTIDGDDLVITIDTKGVMSPEMRDAMIAIISQAAATSGAQAIEISDID